MEVLRLGVKVELQLPAYAPATPDPSYICNPRLSLQQWQILNPLSEARDGTCILMDMSRVGDPLSHNGNFSYHVLLFIFIEKNFFGCTHGIWKFLVQKLNPCCSGNVSHSSDNMVSLTH